MNDDCCRENLGLIADTSISGARVARDLDVLVRIYSNPVCIVSDRAMKTPLVRQTMARGTELTSKAILKWASDNGVEWHDIDPGQSSGKQSTGLFADPPHAQQNGSIESFNASLRDACLNEEIFDRLADARRIRGFWCSDDDNVRPHSSLGNQPPAEARRALERSEGTAPGALATPKTDNYQTKGLSL